VMLKKALAMALMALMVSTGAFAGLNPEITLPLHFKAVSFAQCGDFAPVDCEANRPDLNAITGTGTAFLLANNYTSLAGVQTAFDFGGWTLMFGLWDCQVGQLNAVTPANPGGPTAGTITTAFTPLTTGELAVIGRMVFLIPATGCLSQVQPTYPFGIHVVDANVENDQILDENSGRVGKLCVGAGGIDACDPVTSVEPATWGSVKAQYR
jgi:hypothetical protein